jgi:hypothetical protein
MAMASTGPGAACNACAITCCTEAQRASADCSAQPDCGYCVTSGAAARASTDPSPATTRALVFVVP